MRKNSTGDLARIESLVTLFDMTKKILIGALLLLIAVYYPVLSQHPTLQYDDQSLLLPLSEVHSFDDYLRLHLENKIPDLQPVRDLSYWVEVQIENQTGFRNSQAVNLALWFGIIWITFLVLEMEFPASPWNRFLIFALVMHPVASSSVCWIAARKHLLSAFFLMLATYLSLRSIRQKSKATPVLIYFSYLFSIFSQPISLLWPIWYWIRTRKSQPKNQRLILALGVTAGIVAVLNYAYYTSDLFLASSPDSPPKINAESWRNLLNRFWVLGRYTFQILFPARAVGLPYRLWQWPSYVGLFFLLLGLILIFRFRSSLKASWFLFLALPIILMTAKITHHGGFDTYILVSLIGFGFFISSPLQKIRQGRWAQIFLVAVISVFGFLSHRQARIWTSDYSIYEQGFELEGTIFSTVGFIQLLIDHKEYTRASELLTALEQDDPDNWEIPRLKGRLYFLMDLPVEKKEDIFLKNESESPWYQYYFAVFEVSQGHPELGHRRLLRSWQRDPSQFKITFRSQKNILFANWTKFCEMAVTEDCSVIPNIKDQFSK